jgi:probable rRNA maturation factor
VGVDFRCDTASGREFSAAIRREAKALLAVLDLGNAELSIILTDDAAIRQLNRDFRGKDTPTDVLSFPQIDSAYDGRLPAHDSATAARPPRALGDIVIAVDTARRQAVALRQPPADRLRTLLIHGLLHLIGYDHERSPSAARRMFARERELATTLDQRVARRPRKTNVAPGVRGANRRS